MAEKPGDKLLAIEVRDLAGEGDDRMGNPDTGEGMVKRVRVREWKEGEGDPRIVDAGVGDLDELESSCSGDCTLTLGVRGDFAWVGRGGLRKLDLDTALRTLLPSAAARRTDGMGVFKFWR